MVAELRERAADARALLNGLAPSRVPSAAEVAVARERLALRQRRSVAAFNSTTQEPIQMSLTRISTPWRVAASGLAAALALSLLVTFVPAAQTAAAAFLAQFRSQQVTAIEVTPQSQAEISRTLNALGNLGTVNTPNGLTRAASPARNAGEQSPLVTVADASKTVGFALQTPDPAALPAGVDKTPRVQVMPASQVRFTFDNAKARAYLQSTGHPEVVLPAKFDGATLVVSVPAGVLLQYSSPSAKDGVVIGQSGELVIDVEGNVSLEEMRDFLLSLPGLPAATVNQLKQIKNWNQTLPIPIPVDQVNWQSATFKKNSQGLLLNDNSGVGSAAIWHDNGHMYGVMGPLKATDLKKIADSLAVR